MNRKFQQILRKIVGVALSLAILNLPAPLLAAPEPGGDPGLSSVNTKVDLVNFRNVMSVDVAKIASGLSATDPDYFCKLAALHAAQQGAFQDGNWAVLQDLMAQTARGVELGATIGGQPTVAKAARIAGEIVEALDTDDPAAALGQTIVKEGVDAAAGKAKTGDDMTDDQTKEVAKAVKDKLIEKLFPGKPEKSASRTYTVGSCSVTVAYQFEWPGTEIGQTGGVRLFISGDCHCAKPLLLNSQWTLPTNFSGQTDQVKNCGLGKFSVTIFFPLKRLETSLDYGGTPVNVVKLLQKSASLKKAVKDMMEDKEPDDDPTDIVKDLKDMVDKGTTLSATVTLRPVFGSAQLVDLKAYCNQCDDPQTPPPPPVQENPGPLPETHIPTPAEKRAKDVDDYCALRCKPQYDAWQIAKSEREGLDKQIIPLMMQAAMRQETYQMDPSDLQVYKQAVAKENAAKAAYMACMKDCYQKAVGANLIPNVPNEFANFVPNALPKNDTTSTPPAKSTNSDPKPGNTPAPTGNTKTPKNDPASGTTPVPPTKLPTLGDGAFKTFQPGPGSATGVNQVAYAPPIAGLGSTIVTSVVDPTQDGPQGVVLTTVDETGKRSFFKAMTDNAGKLAFIVPAGIAAFEIARIGQDGTPSTLAHTDVGTATHLPTTDPVPTEQIPTQGPAITEASSTVETSSTNPGTVILHTQGTNPLTTQPYIDGNPMTLRAASDQSVVGTNPPGTPTGTHEYSVTSNGEKSNAVQADVTAVRADPLPPMHSGSVAYVTVYVDGIPENHSPTVHFIVNGAARLASGAPSADVPVKDGIASVEIRGLHPGQVAVTYQVISSVRGNTAIRVGQDVRPDDYVAMDAIVHETLGNQWKAVKRLPGSSVLYQSNTGGQRTASFEKGQIVIR